MVDNKVPIEVRGARRLNNEALAQRISRIRTNYFIFSERRRNAFLDEAARRLREGTDEGGEQR